MTLTSEQSLIIIAAVAVGTILTRFLPFLLFPGNKEMPKYILYLGDVLPFAAIGLLIVYCLKNVSAVSAPYGIPEALAIGSILLLHRIKNSTLLSIGGGTVIYMALIQFVFV
jgi:branched-subunit amino acid transport protein AzlD